MSLGRLARGSALYTGGGLLSRFGAFLLLPVYLRLMAPEEYGVLSLVTAIVGVLGILYRLGLDGALMRFHFEYAGTDRTSVYSSLTLVTLGAATTLTVGFALIAGPLFPSLFFGLPFLPYGALALGIALVSAVDYVPAVLFRAREQPGRFVLFQAGSLALSSLLSLLLLVAGFGVVGVLAGQLLAAGLVLMVVVVLVLVPARMDLSMRMVRRGLSFGLPLVPHALAMWVLRLSDRWLLGALLVGSTTERLAAVGAYSVGYQLGAVVGLVAMSINAAWVPIFFRVGESSLGPAILREAATVVLGGLSLLALVLASFAPEIITLVARPGYEVAGPVLQVVAFGSLAQGAYVMVVSAVFLRHRTAPLPALTAAAAAVNVGLNLILIPRVGVTGAAWATLGAFTLMALLTYFFSRKVYPVSLDLVRLGGIVTACLAGVLVSRLLDQANLVIGATIHSLVVLVAGGVIGVLLVTPIRHLQASLATPNMPARDTSSA